MELHHQIAGQGETVVLVHTGIADSRMWDPQWPALTASRRALRYDMRGFGRSPLPAEPFAHAGDLSELLDRLGIERAAVVAGSMGARVALELAIARPRLVSRLVLAAPGLPGREWSSTVQRYLEAEERAFERGDTDQVVELNLRMWVDGPGRTPDQVDPAVRAAVAAMQRRAVELQEPVGEAAPEHLLVTDLLDRFGEVSAPTLLLVGEHDVVDMHEMAAELADRIPDARLAAITGAAHMPNMEQPGQFDRLVMDFLAAS
jgi:3-oxoadipate enol-lactonase